MENLVEIIDACGKNGVTRLKLQDIEIEFGGFAIHRESDYPKQVESIDKNALIDPNFEKQAEYEQVQDSVEELMITDPARYEESLFGDELENSETHED